MSDADCYESAHSILYVEEEKSLVLVHDIQWMCMICGVDENIIPWMLF